MNIYELNIKSVLDIPEWEKLQDQFARLTGTAMITIDYKGNPVSKISGCTDFCTAILNNPTTRRRCFKCNALAGLEAVKLNKPFIFLCHCGLLDAAVPVVVGERYLGAVIFGQVRIPQSDTDTKLEQETLADLYKRLPEVEHRRIIEIADMLDSAVKYVTNRVLKIRADSLVYGHRTDPAPLPPVLDSEGDLADERFREISSFQAPPRSTDYSGTISNVPVSSPVYPAITYIERNRHERISMQDMAKLCHLSTSYFSKLFLKETGENYTDYFNRKKINWAKDALSNTDENINLISLNLGFQDTSYFVKVFKRYEGITPSQYRNSKRMK